MEKKKSKEYRLRTPQSPGGGRWSEEKFSILVIRPRGPGIFKKKEHFRSLTGQNPKMVYKKTGVAG